jgi:hypothetical protein
LVLHMVRLCSSRLALFLCFRASCRYHRI